MDAGLYFLLEPLYGDFNLRNARLFVSFLKYAWKIEDHNLF